MFCTNTFCALGLCGGGCSGGVLGGPPVTPRASWPLHVLSSTPAGIGLDPPHAVNLAVKEAAFLGPASQGIDRRGVSREPLLSCRRPPGEPLPR